MDSAKQAWLKKQRSARDRSRGAQSKEVQALNRQLTAALQARQLSLSPCSSRGGSGCSIAA